MLRIIKKVIYSNIGKYIISIILGLGLASLFRKVCKDRNCMVFKSPPLKEIKDQVYKHNDSCYEFTEESIQCDNRKKTIEVT